MLQLPKTPGGWHTILLDPPWEYRNMGNGLRGNPAAHYGTLSDEAILHLPIKEILGTDSTIWLWTTNAHLHLAFHCLENYGVQYKTMLTWVKDNFGVGFWLRGQTEHLLLGARGKPPRSMDLDREDFGTGATTAFFAKKGAHSEKPRGIYPLIEELTIPPRLELFARDSREGWRVWGNQAKSLPQGLLQYGER